jgi:hypothetical protein
MIVKRQCNGAFDDSIGNGHIADLAAVFFRNERLQVDRREVVANLNSPIQ